MRRMAIPVILAAMLAVNASAAKLQEAFDRTVDLRAGGTVSIENVNGAVVVNSWDQPRVRIHAVKKVDAFGDDAAREALAEVKINVHSSGDSVLIDTQYPNQGLMHGLLSLLSGGSANASVEYEVTVPRAANLKLDTVNGAMRVSDVNGAAKLETTNGAIEVVRCGGSVDASTTNGAIRVELTQVAPGRGMTLETTNGGIVLIVPPTLAANLEAETTNGSIHADLPVSTKDFSKHSVHGTINGGGPRLALSTTNGSIDIRTR